MRWMLGIAILVLAVGCGQAGTGGEVACPAIGTPTGIGLTIPAGVPVSTATLEACWDGRCVTRPVDLRPATQAGQTTCTGSVCSASVKPTGGLTGFADIPGLPAQPVKVTVTFDGKPHHVDVTPGFTHPGGPGCEGGGPQAQLVAGPDLALRPA